MVGIITNNAALFAQRNLQDASKSSELSIGRLSSGNRIIRAADDVSGLAIGTVLATNVSTLKTVLTSASQAQSLLQIADGGLANIGNILQRQKALAVQANSDSLSDNERAYLNEEFTSLTSEIDRLVDGTTFNGISLLDGSILNTTAVGTNVSDKGTAASTTINITGVVVSGEHLTFSDGSNQRTVIFSATGGGGYTIDAGDLSASQAQAGLLAWLQGDVAQNDDFFRQFDFGTSFSSNSLTVTAKNTVTAGNSFTIAAVDETGAGGSNNTVIGSGAASASEIAFTGGTAGDLTAGRVSYDTTNTATYGDSLVTDYVAQLVDTYTIALGAGATNADAVTITINGETQTFTFGTLVNEITSSGTEAIDAVRLAEAINESSLSAYVNAYVDPSASSVVALQFTKAGTIAGDAVSSTANITTTHTVTGTGGGIHVGSVVNNSAFVGTISGFTATYLSEDSVQARITIGDHTYVANVDDTAPGAATFLRFTSEGDGILGGGFFDVQLAASALSVTDQDDANTFAARLDAAFSNVTFEQTRDLDADSYTGVGNIYVNSTRTGSLGNSSVDFNLKDYSSQPEISDINVTAPSAGSSDAKISITLKDGRVFTIDGLASTTADNLATETNNTFTDSILNSSTISLRNETDPDEFIKITFGTAGLTDSNGNTTNVVLVETDAQAAAFEEALKTAFGLGSGGLSFQTGLTSGDNIAVAIGGSTTEDLYKDEDGIYTELSISTSEGAEAAVDVLDNAIRVVTTLRATVGALQSRFNYATANITTSIQNQEAARADFLDVDIASESTSFAQAQVRLQASISVLAQANQIPQNLLKLIG